MIVCLCNNLNDKRVRSAIASGAQTADDVYARCGVERNCGRCQETIETMLESAAVPVLQAAE
jgi:bacterioferritin-associated ferredoxin